MPSSVLASFDFNPRSPCGERLPYMGNQLQEDLIFQSALPLRGATVPRRAVIHCSDISIRAPLAGSDTLRLTVY